MPGSPHMRALQRSTQTLGGLKTSQAERQALSAQITHESGTQQTANVFRGQDASPKTRKDSSQVRTYTVKKDETLSDIAQRFNLSEDTIIVANQLEGPDDISPGDTLDILPMDGVAVSPKNTTPQKLADKYDVSVETILQHNDVSQQTFADADQILVPNADIPYSELPHKRAPVRIASGYSQSGNVTHDRMGSGFFAYPAQGNIKPHWGAKRGVDILGPRGSDIRASAPGQVIAAGLHGGGYGYYVVIQHANGAQTVYAHMIRGSLTVSKGDHVDKDTVLGKMGNTGWSTGDHLHFEIRPNR